MRGVGCHEGIVKEQSFQTIFAELPELAFLSIDLQPALTRVVQRRSGLQHSVVSPIGCANHCIRKRELDSLTGNSGGHEENRKGIPFFNQLEHLDTWSSEVIPG